MALKRKMKLSIPPGGKFLPNEEPIQKILHKDFEHLNDIAHRLPELYQSGQIREEVLKLPPMKVNHLDGQELDCFLRQIGFITSAYVWTPARETTFVIPEQIAVPHYQATKKFNPAKLPILSYWHYSSTNCKRIFLDEPLGLENCQIIDRFTHLPDEEGFIKIHYIQNSLESLAAIENGLVGVSNKDEFLLESGLLQVADITHYMRRVLMLMIEECDPIIYFKYVRRPIMFFRQPIYEGVPEPDNKPEIARGETGAQSLDTPVRDAFLGIQHQQTGLMDYLSDLRKYMPPAHLKFIDEVRSGPSVRNYVLKTKKPRLIGAYNYAVEEFYRLRDQHYQWACLYVFDQSTEDRPVGTGGTPKEWLRQLRDETIAHRINWDVKYFLPPIK